MNSGLVNWLKNYVGEGYYSGRFEFSVYKGRKPTITWEGSLYVGRGWLKRKAKKDPELMTALVLEEL